MRMTMRREKTKMTLQNTKTIAVELPNKATINAIVPDCFSDKAVELLFRSLLGTIYGIRSLSEELRKQFMLRFVGEIVSLSENAVRTIQMSNQLEGTNPEDTAKVIEQFIASLGKQNDNKTQS